MKKKNIWEIENLFYLNSAVSRLNKIICHYEIFKLTKKVPGEILEFGVFKGNSLIRFLSFRDLIDIKKKIVQLRFKRISNYEKMSNIDTFINRKHQELEE